MKHEVTGALVDLHIYNKGYDENIIIPCKWVDFFTANGNTEVVFCDAHGKEQRINISSVVIIVPHKG